MKFANIPSYLRTVAIAGFFVPGILDSRKEKA